MKSIIYVSEFAIGAGGSGYGGIAQELCQRMREYEIGVVALGLDYEGAEHPYMYPIVPTRPHKVPMLVKSLMGAEDVDFVALVTAMDIPRQIRLRRALQSFKVELPQIAIFPVEAGPLCETWAMGLAPIDKSLVISKFGTKFAQDVGLDATFIPVGVNPELWRKIAKEDREEIRDSLNIPSDAHFVLTVADNQERKNLTAALEIMAKTIKELPDQNILYGLVTRPELAIGYQLMDYIMELGILHRVRIWKRGMTQEGLWALFASADAFLLTSKAEGLGLPVLEAMSCGLPVVGTDCAAIAEHLANGRGYPVKWNHRFRDAWGNEWRYLIDVEDGAKQVIRALTESPNGIVEQAHAYATQFTWDAAAQVFVEAVRDVSKA